MSIEIRKAGIRSGIFLAYEYNIEEAGISAKNKTQSMAPIHDDLKAAFDKLIPHFILLTEELPEDRVKGIIENDLLIPEDIQLKYTVTEFALGGSEDSKTITITGYKILSNDKSVSFSTPSQKLYDDKKDGYKYSDFLRDILDILLDEVQQYMDGKQAPRNEVGSFDFDADEDEAFSMPSKKKNADPIIEGGDED